MLNTNHSALADAAPIVMEAITRQSDLKLVLSDNPQPYINLKTRTMHLPSPPVTMSENERIKLFGFMHHECSHAVNSTIVDTENNQILQQLHNIFEDGRIEYLHMKKWPGAKSKLLKLVSVLVDEGFFSSPSQDMQPASIFCMYILYKLRAQYLKQEALRPYLEQLEPIFDNVFSEALRNKLDALCSLLYQTVESSSELSLMLAKEAIKALQSEQKPEEPNSDNQSNADDSNGQTSNTSPDSDDPTQDGTPSQDPAGMNSDADDSSHDNDAQGTVSKDVVDSVLNAKSDELDSSLGDLGDALGQSIPKDPCPSNPFLYHESKETGVADINLLNEALSVSAKSSAQLKALLSAKTRKYRRRQTLGLRIDDRSFERMVTHSPNIFMKRRETKGVDTAITLLLDASSSMNSQMALATIATLATAVTLESVPNVSVCCASFYGSKDVTVIKPFDKKSKTISSAFRARPRGSTPMSEGLYWALRNIHQARKTRNIVITITDGVPDDRHSCEELISKLNQANVETWAIGVGDNAQYVKNLFNLSQHINSADKIATALLSLFKMGYTHSYK